MLARFRSHFGGGGAMPPPFHRRSAPPIGRANSPPRGGGSHRHATIGRWKKGVEPCVPTLVRTARAGDDERQDRRDIWRTLLAEKRIEPPRNEWEKVIGERLPRNERNKLDVKRSMPCYVREIASRYRDCSLPPPSREEEQKA